MARRRCYEVNNPKYPMYGGRGIRVCDEWRSDYLAFLSYMGRRPSALHSIDRIDNDGDYEPGNVRWATAAEQARNRRGPSLTEADAIRMRELARSGMRQADIAALYGCSQSSVWRVIHRRMTWTKAPAGASIGG